MKEDIDWPVIETRVREAEVNRRRANQASNVLARLEVSEGEDPNSSRARLIAAARKQLTEDGVLQAVPVYSRRVARAALSNETIYNQQADELMGETNSAERALVGLQQQELVIALRKEHQLEGKRKELMGEEVEVLKSIKEEPTVPEQEALDELRADLKIVKRESIELLESSPEAYFGLHLKQLKEYKNQLAAKQIVETDYVKSKIDDVLVHFLAGKPVMIHGHLGTGKTELAMHIARKYVGADALVISGSKHISMAEFYGHQVLTLDRLNPDELRGFMREVESLYEQELARKQADKGEIKEEEKDRLHNTVLQTQLTTLKSGTISEYFLGPIYKAMEEGRPVIVDEVNAIPHEVLISLNHILTRKPGDVINVQQDSGRVIKVKEGFGIMMTGNLNQGVDRYVDRQDMDPAFLSRLYKVDYDYLPQATEGSLDEAGQENELFLLMMAKVMDRNGNVYAPANTFNKLWRMAQAARITQDVFAGKAVNQAFYFQEGGGRQLAPMLKESVMSIRAIMAVLNQWQKEGYKHELDYYIWQDFVSQSTVASDKAYLYQLFKDRFNFFQGEGWEQTPEYGSGGIVRAFDVKPPQNEPGKKQFFGPREVVEKIFGEAPERAKYPEFTLPLEQEDVQEEELVINSELQDLMSYFEKVTAEIEDCKQLTDTAQNT